jgi:hypothetical protein
MRRCRTSGSSSGSKGGGFPLHLPPLEKHGQKWNHLIEAVEVNFQPLARHVPGNLTIPAAIDIPLAPGEVKLLSLRAQETRHADTPKVTTKLAIEWIENPPEDKPAATP